MGGIELKGIGKVYEGGVAAVRDLDLEVAEGELVVLLGPSGCGKSTILRLVAGLATLSTGEIHIAGRRVDAVPAKDRDVAMVFQSYALYGHMTVRRNLEFPLRMRGVGAEERRRRVQDVARMLELEPILEHRPSALSGGQQQRVAMGRALVREPRAFLLDEPLSNLDARLRGQVRVHIAEIQRRLGVTTLYVTHDQVEALSLGHRVAVLRAGRLQQVGTGRTLYEEPANAFVAQFVGQPGMNLLVGRLARDDGRWHVDLAGASLSLTEAAFSGGGAGTPPETGREVLVGVRPEGLTLAADARPVTPLAGGSGGNASVALLGAEVRTVEAVGPRGVCYLATDLRTADANVAGALDGEPVAGAAGAGGPPLAVHTGRADAVEVGARVRVGIDPAAVRLFARDGSAIG